MAGSGDTMSAPRRGFLSLEYAVLIVVCAASFLAMAVYIKRSVMGKWRTSADTMGFGRQYEPGVTAR